MVSQDRAGRQQRRRRSEGTRDVVEQLLLGWQGLYAAAAQTCRAATRSCSSLLFAWSSITAFFRTPFLALSWAGCTDKQGELQAELQADADAAAAMAAPYLGVRGCQLLVLGLQLLGHCFSTRPAQAGPSLALPPTATATTVPDKGNVEQFDTANFSFPLARRVYGRYALQPLLWGAGAEAWTIGVLLQTKHRRRVLCSPLCAARMAGCHCCMCTVACVVHCRSLSPAARGAQRSAATRIPRGQRPAVSVVRACEAPPRHWHPVLRPVPTAIHSDRHIT